MVKANSMQKKIIAVLLAVALSLVAFAPSASAATQWYFNFKIGEKHYCSATKTNSYAYSSITHLRGASYKFVEGKSVLGLRVRNASNVIVSDYYKYSTFFSTAKKMTHVHSKPKNGTGLRLYGQVDSASLYSQIKTYGNWTP